MNDSHTDGDSVFQICAGQHSMPGSVNGVEPRLEHNWRELWSLCDILTAHTRLFPQLSNGQTMSNITN